MPMKKGSLVNNSYIFEQIFFLSPLVSSKEYPLVKCKRLEESYNASGVYSRWNMSTSKKIISILWKNADVERYAR